MPGPRTQPSLGEEPSANPSVALRKKLRRKDWDTYVARGDLEIGSAVLPRFSFSASAAAKLCGDPEECSPLEASPTEPPASPQTSSRKLLSFVDPAAACVGSGQHEWATASRGNTRWLDMELRSARADLELQNKLRNTLSGQSPLRRTCQDDSPLDISLSPKAIFIIDDETKLGCVTGPLAWAQVSCPGD